MWYNNGFRSYRILIVASAVAFLGATSLYRLIIRQRRNLHGTAAAAAATIASGGGSGSTLTLPSSWYGDNPEQFRREMEAVFTRHWLFAGDVRQLLPQGSEIGTSSITVAGYPIILCRTSTEAEDGGQRIVGYHNVCRHRAGTLTSHDEDPTYCPRPGVLRCRYHGWTYGADTGELRVTPGFGPADGLDKSKYPLFPVRVDLLCGWMLFVCLDPDAEPFKNQFHSVITQVGWCGWISSF